MSSPIDPARIDPDAAKVVRRLRQHDHAAYLVGGCVRDLLLGRKPKDFDVATSATPQQVKSLFRNCRIIGRRFRLAHIVFGPKIIETSTFRCNPREDQEDEGELLIRRDNVFGTAEEDAYRRDFTINGLFYDLPAERVIDYVGGLADLEARQVRTIGPPDIRLREDPVRILRAIRFAARLDFQIEPETYRAAIAWRQEILHCAPPRVLEEVYRLLRAGAACRSMELLCELGLLPYLWPELARRLLTPVAETAGPPFPRSPTADLLLRTLAALDGAVLARSLQPSNAVLLASLLAPLLRDILYGGGSGIHDALSAIDALLQPTAERLHASRRDREWARQILVGQMRLAGRRRARPAVPATQRRDYFEDTLLLRRLAEETGALPPLGRPPGERVGEREERGARRERGEQALRSPGSEGSDAGGHGRRRRRRGRRRGRAMQTAPGLSSPGSVSDPQPPPQGNPAA
jgi:poly(A) polymerase